MAFYESVNNKIKIKKGEINVSEEKTGTQYVREMCETFKEIAATTKFDTIKEKLNALATELEPMAEFNPMAMGIDNTLRKKFP